MSSPTLLDKICAEDGRKSSMRPDMDHDEGNLNGHGMTSDKGLANVAVVNPKKIIKLKIGNVSKNNSTLDTVNSNDKNVADANAARNVDDLKEALKKLQDKKHELEQQVRDKEASVERGQKRIEQRLSNIVALKREIKFVAVFTKMMEDFRQITSKLTMHLPTTPSPDAKIIEDLLEGPGGEFIKKIFDDMVAQEEGKIDSETGDILADVTEPNERHDARKESAIGAVLDPKIAGDKTLVNKQKPSSKVQQGRKRSLNELQADEDVDIIQ